MKKRLSPGELATVVFCALMLGTGIVALALFGAPAVVPALVGSSIISAAVAGLVFVIYSREEFNRDP